VAHADPGVGDGVRELARVERLRDPPVRAELERPDRGLGLSPSRHHHDREPRILGAQTSEQLDPRFARHRDDRQDQVRHRLRHRDPRLGRTGRHPEPMALALQHPTQGAADLVVVVDDQDLVTRDPTGCVLLDPHQPTYTQG
jgi:hypothetical protein